jgi:hypothetical protein
MVLTSVILLFCGISTFLEAYNVCMVTELGFRGSKEDNLLTDAMIN